MKAIQKKLLLLFINKLSNFMGRSGCNDFDMTDDEYTLSDVERKELLALYNEYHLSDDPDAMPETGDVLYDFIVLGMVKKAVQDIKASDV